MGHSMFKKALRTACAACLALQYTFGDGTLLTPSRQVTVRAIQSYANATVANQGKSDEPAVIRGRSTNVVYDEANDSNVLVLGGGSFGAGWLQLPALFDSVGNDGFSLSMQFSLGESSANYARLFQMSPIAFGGGSAPSYSSPDLSLDLCDKETYRASVFVGKELTTADDDAHRSIFKVLTKPDSNKWHDLSAVYTPSALTFYLDSSIDNSDGT